MTIKALESGDGNNQQIKPDIMFESQRSVNVHRFRSRHIDLESLWQIICQLFSTRGVCDSKLFYDPMSMSSSS